MHYYTDSRLFELFVGASTDVAQRLRVSPQNAMVKLVAIEQMLT